MQSLSVPQSSKGTTTDKLYMESTLLRVIGALFCHDAKRARTRSGKIRLDKGSADKHIEILPHPKYGQPGPLAHKTLIALIKKHSDYGRPVQRDVSFSKRELCRLIGRIQWGGSDSQQLAFALHSIQGALITASFKADNGSYYEDRFTIFPRVILQRARSHEGPIEACTVTLADPIITSLEADHFTCLNYRLMQELGTIGQALYLRIFFHLANIYDGRSRSRLEFSKRYDDICAEWLGGLTVLEHRSNIIRDQLGPHLKQLVQLSFLSGYALDRTVDGAFKLTFRPGRVFFEDYDRYYRRRQQGQLQWEYHGDRASDHEPMKAAALFVEKNTGAAQDAIASVFSSDVKAARAILEQISYADFPAFLEYSLKEARRTRFDVQRLAGLKQYVPAYLKATRTRKASDQRAHDDAARRRQHDREAAFSQWTRDHAQELFKQLPASERKSIHTEITEAVKPGPMAGILTEIALAKAMQRRYPDQFTSFEDWASHGKAGK